MPQMSRLSLDDLARVASGIEILGGEDLVVFHYPDSEWSLGTPGRERMTRKELLAIATELLERRAEEVPEPDRLDLEAVRVIAADALAKARDRA